MCSFALGKQCYPLTMERECLEWLSRDIDLQASTPSSPSPFSSFPPVSSSSKQVSHRGGCLKSWKRIPFVIAIREGGGGQQHFMTNRLRAVHPQPSPLVFQCTSQRAITYSSAPVSAKTLPSIIPSSHLLKDKIVARRTLSLPKFSGSSTQTGAIYIVLNREE